MASKDSDCRPVKRQKMDDATTCYICTEVYTNPKALPCLHAFCMKCIQKIGLKTKKGSGDEMPCPICRQLFKIPTEGFLGLPTRFFNKFLLQSSNASDQSASAISISDERAEENEEAGKKIAASDAKPVVLIDIGLNRLAKNTEECIKIFNSQRSKNWQIKVNVLGKSPCENALLRTSISYLKVNVLTQ